MILKFVFYEVLTFTFLVCFWYIVYTHFIQRYNQNYNQTLSQRGPNIIQVSGKSTPHVTYYFCLRFRLTHFSCLKHFHDYDTSCDNPNEFVYVCALDSNGSWNAMIINDTKWLSCFLRKYLQM